MSVTSTTTVLICALSIWLAIRTSWHGLFQAESGPHEQTMKMNIAYVPGFFQHDTLPVGPGKGFRAQTLPELGILPKTYPTDADFDPEHRKSQWQRFKHYISYLNAQDPTRARYKVFFVVRHGEGVHNVQEREVGREEWERTYARREGDGTTTWLNAPLTPLGKNQAQTLATTVLNSILTAGLPLPQKVYTSPLQRALETTETLVSTLSSAGHDDLGGGASRHSPSQTGGKSRTRIPVVVKESLRETIGQHTCDRRGNLIDIRLEFPDFEVEKGFTEDDELWREDERETTEEIAARVKGFLEGVFEFNGREKKEDEEVSGTGDDEGIVLVAHSGTIRGLYAATGHPEVWPAVGAMFPLFVKGQTLKNERGLV